MTVVILQQVACEGPGLFAELLPQWSVPFRTVRLYEGDAIASLGPQDALVVLGGPMNVYEEDRFPFLAEEVRALQAAVALGIPVLGVCLGAQLLAKALGAPVTPNAVKEIGYYEVRLTRAGTRDPLLQGLGTRPTVFQWHGDTFALPQDAVRLATSATCLNQAFRHGPRAYGLQFHLEATPQMVAEWVAEYGNEVQGLGERASARLGPADSLACAQRMARLGERLLDNFLSLPP